MIDRVSDFDDYFEHLPTVFILFEGYPRCIIMLFLLR